MLREPVAGEEDATSLSSMLSSQAEVVQGGGEEGTKRKARSKGEKKKDKKKDKKTAAQEAEQQPAASQAKGSSSVPAAAVPAVLPEGKQNTAEEEKPKAEDQASGRRATRNAEAMASQLAKTRKAKNEIWTGDQSKLLLLMMKLILQGAQNSREFASILFDVFLAPAECPLVHSCRVQGRRYAAAVASPGHGLGSPWLYVFGALLDSLATLPGAESVDSSNSQNYEKLLLSQRGELVKLCKVAQVYKTSQVKIVMAFGPGPDALELRSRVLLRLSALDGFEHKQGKSPATHMERVLSAWVEAMVS